jgi:hypothetical protein
VAFWVFALEAIFLLTPLFLASLARPFALWDYMTGLALYMPSDPLHFRSLFENYRHNLLASGTSVSRPTYALVLNLQYLLFGGEFWIFYLVKWAAKLATIYLVDGMLAGVQASRWSRLAIASVLLFHPNSFELMLTSADGWVAFFGVFAIAATVMCNRSRSAPMDIGSMPARQYAVVLLLWFLALGTKEAGMALAIAWLVMAHIDSRLDRRFFLRVSFCYAAVVWFAFRLLAASKERRANFTAGESPSVRLSVLRGHLEYMVPGSLYGWIGVVAVILAALTIWTFLRSRNRLLRSLMAVNAIWGILTLLLVSTTNSPAPRYVIPVIYAMAVPFGLAMSHAPRRLGGLWAAVALLFPLAMSGDLYRQALAYQQLLYETSDVIAAAQNHAAAGRAICLTGDDQDIPLENQFSLRLFFERFGPQWYRQPAYSVAGSIHNTGVPRRGCALIARYDLSELLASGIRGLSPAMIQDAYEFSRTGYGILEALTAKLAPVSRVFGRGSFTLYDVGAPVVTPTPAMRVYLLDPRCGSFETPQNLIAQFSNPAQSVLRKEAMEPGKTYTYQSAAREAVKWQIHIETGSGLTQVFYGGDYRLTRGSALFGISDETGRDLWAVALAGGEDWRPLPTAPALDFPPGHQYFLFAFSQDPQGLMLSFRDVRLREEPGFIRAAACPDLRTQPLTAAATFSNPVAGVQSATQLAPGKTYSYTARAGEPVKWQIAAPPQDGRALLFYGGQYRLTRGSANFGITDRRGNDLWAAVLKSDDTWHDLPVAPPLAYRPTESYFFFVFSNGASDTEFAIRDLQTGPAIRTKVGHGVRRFGALGW